jgi:hypothetical protein
MMSMQAHSSICLNVFVSCCVLKLLARKYQNLLVHILAVGAQTFACVQLTELVVRKVNVGYEEGN